MGQGITRRTLLCKSIAGVAAAAPFFGPWRANRVYASSTDKPIRIGLLHSATGQYGVSGQAEMRGTTTAIAQANADGGLLGRKLETIWADSQTDAHTARLNTQRFIVENEVSFLVGAVHSSVAKAVSEVAQEFGCIYLNTNSSSPTESAADCHRVKFVYDAHGLNFAKATAAHAAKNFGTRWLLLTNDYGWGHHTAKAIRAIGSQFNVDFIDEILVPVGTRNYIGILKKIANTKPDVVATAIGGDDSIPLRAQAVDMGLHKRPAWLNNQQDWPDHFAMSEAALFGIFGTTWYHGLKLPGVTEFVKQYKKHWPDAAITVPGNVYYNGYTAMQTLFDAIRKAGTTNNIAVIKQLEATYLPARDRMQHYDAYMDPASHHLQQTVYIASNNDNPATERDYYKILAAVRPEDAADANERNCRMESYAQTPTYEL